MVLGRVSLQVVKFSLVSIITPVLCCAYADWIFASDISDMFLITYLQAAAGLAHI